MSYSNRKVPLSGFKRGMLPKDLETVAPGAGPRGHFKQLFRSDSAEAMKYFPDHDHVGSPKTAFYQE